MLPGCVDSVVRCALHADRRAEELEGLGCRLSGGAHAADRRMEGLAGLGGALDLGKLGWPWVMYMQDLRRSKERRGSIFGGSESQ